MFVYEHPLTKRIYKSEKMSLRYQECDVPQNIFYKSLPDVQFWKTVAYGIPNNSTIPVDISHTFAGNLNCHLP